MDSESSHEPDTEQSRRRKRLAAAKQGVVYETKVPKPNNFTLRMKAVNCPSDKLSLKNRCIVNRGDFATDIEHIELFTGADQSFLFAIQRSDEMPPSSIGFSMPQRMWASLAIDQEIDIKPYIFDTTQPSANMRGITLEVDFLDKSVQTTMEFDAAIMGREFIKQFSSIAVTVGQPLVFLFKDVVLALTVMTVNPASDASMEMRFGRLLGRVHVRFVKAEGSSINLYEQGDVNLHWDFDKMGIGGLELEFNTLFRRAFASRVYTPPEMRTFECKHVQGVLLYGPPGTGKSLMARQISTMLNTREPKIVSGPQLLDQCASDPEANIRQLFADAAEDEKRLGPTSSLHIIIIDQIDVICKARGAEDDNSSDVSAAVARQLMSRLDGYAPLHNVLVIGMTNHRERIDAAMLRPGRLEVQLEIGLPDEAKRFEILNVHMNRMRELQMIGHDVDTHELAAATDNYNGSLLHALVRSARSNAMARQMKSADCCLESLQVSRYDYMLSIDSEVRMSKARAQDKLNGCLTNGFVHWSAEVSQLLEEGMLFTQQARAPESRGRLVSVLLAGPPKSGKTAMAAKLAQLAQLAGFASVQIISPLELFGLPAVETCLVMNGKFEEAYKSKLSCIVLDNVEGLFHYGSLGPKYSNLLMQTLAVLLSNPPPLEHKLLIFATSSKIQLLREMELHPAFTYTLQVPNLTEGKHVMAVLEGTDVFSKEQLDELSKTMEDMNIFVGIKMLFSHIEKARQTEAPNRVKTFLFQLINSFGG